MSEPRLSDARRAATFADAFAMMRASFWLSLGRKVRAVSVLERALARGAHGTLHRHRARILASLGRQEEAVEALRSALRFDPLDGTTRLEVVETLIALGWDKERLGAFMDEFVGGDAVADSGSS